MGERAGEICCPVCGAAVKRCEWVRGEEWSADGWRMDFWTYAPCGCVRGMTEVKR